MAPSSTSPGEVESRDEREDGHRVEQLLLLARGTNPRPNRRPGTDKDRDARADEERRQSAPSGRLLREVHGRDPGEGLGTSSTSLPKRHTPKVSPTCGVAGDSTGDGHRTSTLRPLH